VLVPLDGHFNAKITIIFSNKIYGSNFIKRHSETVMVWNYQYTDYSLKEINLFCYLLYFRHTFVVSYSPNGCSIDSAASSGLTFVTQRQTDRLRYMCSNSPHLDYCSMHCDSAWNHRCVFLCNFSNLANIRWRNTADFFLDISYFRRCFLLCHSRYCTTLSFVVAFQINIYLSLYICQFICLSIYLSTRIYTAAASVQATACIWVMGVAGLDICPLPQISSRTSTPATTSVIKVSVRVRIYG